MSPEHRHVAASPGDIGYQPNIGELRAILTEHEVDELIVTDSDFTERELLELVEQAHRSGVKVRIAPKTTELLTQRAEYVPGQASFGGSIEPVGEATGWITALDSETGAVRWKYHAEKPVVAGITPTAGGVTFAGDLAGNLLVFNRKTGQLVVVGLRGGPGSVQMPGRVCARSGSRAE